MANLVRIPWRQNETQRDISLLPDWTDGSLAGIRLKHNPYLGFWYLSLLDSNLVQYWGPLRMVCGVDLLSFARYHPLTPPGQLFCASPDYAEPNKDNVDVSCFLYYRPL